MAQATGGVYTPTNLLSDGYVPAAYLDKGFVDPWGVSGGGTLWINTNVTGFSYVVPLTAITTASPAPLTPTASAQVSFKSTIPLGGGATGSGQPTGTVQNTDPTATDFVLPNQSTPKKASFLFATGDGTISGWNSLQTSPTYTAVVAIDHSAQNAVYTDLALLPNAVTSPTAYFLLAPNFGAGGTVEIYNASFQPATLPGGTFTDPSIPTGYAPYAVKVIGSQVFVAYMLRTTPPFAAGAGTYQEILGTNTGFVSVFSLAGAYQGRVVTGGLLNAPWGIAIAPASFGIYAGDLLIGNFGDGLITAYNPTTFAFQGVVADLNGKPIANPGLWAIFSNTTANTPGATGNALYFTAGLDGETHGLFGYISNVTNATSTPTFNLSTSTTVPAAILPGSNANFILSIAPVNSFAGSVSFSCSGLPVGGSCSFTLPQLAVTGTAPATEMMSISAGAPTYGMLRGNDVRSLGIASALLLPFGSLLVLRRRKEFAALRVLSAMVLLLAATGAVVGCSYSTPAAMGGTPAGTSKVTVTATSGAITQSTVVTLTVQ